jgi:hypothetical protein
MPPGTLSMETPMRNLRRRLVIAILMVAASVALVTIMSRSLPIRLLDLDNYLSATRMISRRQNPYGQVEFFAPPWLTLLLLPLAWLPAEASAAIWLILSSACVAGSALLAFHWLECGTRRRRLLFAMTIPTLMPGALFSYITGQISPLVGAAVLFAAWQISAGSRIWLPALALLLATLKPHIVAVPAAICVLELIRRRRWRTLVAASMGLAILVGLATIWQPEWIPSLIKLWAGQDYKGGAPDLISPGYRGLRELGIPVWAFLPLVAYTLWRWWHDGLQPYVFALAVVVNLLVIPYSRSYDFVVLILPLVYLTSLMRKRDYWLTAASIISAFVLPFTALAVLSPVVLSIAALVKATSRPALARSAPPMPAEALNPPPDVRR